MTTRDGLQKSWRVGLNLCGDVVQVYLLLVLG